MVADHDDAPRHGERLRRQVDACRDRHLTRAWIVVSAWCQDGFYAETAVAAAGKPGNRIMARIGFGQGKGRVALTGLADQRRIEQVEVADLRGFDRVELAFVAVDEATLIGAPAGIVGGEVITRTFAGDCDVLESALLVVEQEAHGGAAIVSAQNDAVMKRVLPGLIEGQSRLVITIGDVLRLADDHMIGLVDGLVGASRQGLGTGA